jgi:hypothetical protein
MFHIYDVVKLKNDIPAQALSAGIRGTILLVYRQPLHPPIYEVEFVDDEGTIIAITQVQEENLEAPLPAR